MSLSRAQQATILTAIKANTLKLELYSTDPTSSDVGVAADWGSYVPQTITFGANTVVGNGTEITNNSVITFPTATSDATVAVTHFGIRINGGDLVSYGELTSLGVPVSRLVKTGDFFQIGSGIVKIRLPD